MQRPDGLEARAVGQAPAVARRVVGGDGDLLPAPAADLFDRLPRRRFDRLLRFPQGGEPARREDPGGDALTLFPAAEREGGVTPWADGASDAETAGLPSLLQDDGPAELHV